MKTSTLNPEYKIRGILDEVCLNYLQLTDEAIVIINTKLQ